MIITQTPFRISFAGGGSDFKDFYTSFGGAVIGSTIDKYIYCIVKKRFDKYVYVNYSKKEIVKDVGLLKHDLVREALKKVNIQNGIEISFLADVPSQGSGLGSSSSVLVGVLNALYHYVGHVPTRHQLAEEACEIEIDILGKPIGVQDQYFAAFGGLSLIHFNKSGEIIIEKLQIPEETKHDLNNSLMMFFTGKTRKSETILQEHVNNLSQKSDVIKKMVLQTTEIHESLSQGDIGNIGPILNRAWELKKSLASKVTNGSIESMYQRALAAGAVGGKILGAGGGGFMLLSVPENKKQSVRTALGKFQELHFRLENTGTRVIFNDGR